MSLYSLVESLSDTELYAYQPIAKDFVTYLDDVLHKKIRLIGTKEGEKIVIEDEYIHRFTPRYAKRFLAKTYQLEEWYRDHPGPVTMLTLTTYQMGDYSRQRTGGGYTIPESFEALKMGWRRLTSTLRKELPGLDYWWIIEPHKSGYPHLHIAIFADLPEDLRNRLSNLWEKYDAGSAEYGVNFSISAPKDLKSVRNYLVKYMAKGLNLEDSPHGEPAYAWTPQELVFYSLAWEHHWRLWGASRNLSHVMKKPVSEDTGVWWLKTEIVDEYGDVLSEVWHYSYDVDELAEEMEGVEMPFICAKCNVEMDLEYDSKRKEKVRVCPVCGNRLYWDIIIRSLERERFMDQAPHIKTVFEGGSPKEGEWYRVC